MVQTHTNEWYMVHLIGRPVQDKFCNLGRETAIQRCYWTDDLWLRVEGGPAPSERVQAPDIVPHPFAPTPETDDFDQPVLAVDWSTLRIPPEPSWVTLTERPGYLRLKGMESMSSTHRQSMVARRQQSFYCESETCLEFEPEHFQQMAGLILYYDTMDYIYLRVTRDEDAGKTLGLIQSVKGQYNELLEQEIGIEGVRRVGLKAVIEGAYVQFWYSADGGEWNRVGEKISVIHLSDDFSDYVRFTGTFIGLCAQDLSGSRQHADFDYFSYRETDEIAKA